MLRGQNAQQAQRSMPGRHQAPSPPLPIGIPCFSPSSTPQPINADPSHAHPRPSLGAVSTRKPRFSPLASDPVNPPSPTDQPAPPGERGNVGGRRAPGGAALCQRGQGEPAGARGEPVGRHAVQRRGKMGRASRLGLLITSPPPRSAAHTSMARARLPAGCCSPSAPTAPRRR